MITGSILLALVAAAFLLIGITASDGTDVFFYSSIVGSVLAGFALFVGLRYRPGAQLPEDDFDGPLPSDRRRAALPQPQLATAVRPHRATGRASVAAIGLDEPPPSDTQDGWPSEEGWEPDGGWVESGWEEGVPGETWRAGEESPATAGLPDEPGEQELTATMAARVARLEAEVVVIDGRPRYHLGECLHLLGRSTQRLPVMEAVELGFTPCGDCEPATALLEESHS